MKRMMWVALVTIASTAGSMLAHHGYTEYDRNAIVSLEGTITKVMWINPHVLLTLETKDRGEYTVEWGSMNQLQRQRVQVSAVKTGDYLVVTGSINRNPEKRIITLLRDVDRPSDKWHWTVSIGATTQP